MTALVPSPERAREVLSTLCTMPESDDEILDIYASAVWTMLTEPGDRIAGRMIQARGPHRALSTLGSGQPPEGVSAKEYRAALDRWRPRAHIEELEKAFQTAQRRGVRLLTRRDEVWPDQLEDLGEHAPAALWVRGSVRTLGVVRPAVAIVGARAASGYGEQVAAEIAGDLAAGGVTIVSGAAYGIDAAAHRAALAVEGTTIAFLAGGVDVSYPRGNTELLTRITRSGVVLSECPPGASPTRWRFLARNRMIAALADVTVVVEAGARSGSLNTAGHAASLGRALGAVPGPVTSASSMGTHRLLREYDAICVTGAEDVREMLGIGSAAPIVTAATPESIRVWDALGVRSWRAVDDLARRSGLSPSDVEATLGELVLEGRVVQRDGSWRRNG